MEAIAITLLVLVLAVGGLSLFVFLQFLSTVRESQRSFLQIRDDISALRKQLEKPVPSSTEKNAGERAD
ncbi:MAG TPA: hypothetical protein VM658_08660 [bacterium]|nr:hypothetical protein [bacterium]